jgi:hypothetical protein
LTLLVDSIIMGEEEPVVRLVYAPRRLEKFDGVTRNIGDWEVQAKDAILAQGLKGQPAADYLLAHLEGPACDEVKFSPLEERKDSDGVIAILKAAFGEQATENELLDAFFSRHQGPKETLREYSHALMSLLDRAFSVNDKVLTNKDHALRDQFAEKIRDETLRNILKLTISTDNKKTFKDIRQQARRWTGERKEEPGVKKEKKVAEMSIQGAVTIPKEEYQSLQEQMADLVIVQRKQQEMIEKLLQHGQQSEQPRAQVPTGTGDDQKFGGNRRKPRGPCHHCGKMGHLKRECWLLKQERYPPPQLGAAPMWQGAGMLPPGAQSAASGAQPVQGQHPNFLSPPQQ